MRTSSCKAKGRRLQQEVRDTLLSKQWLPPWIAEKVSKEFLVSLRPGDIAVAIMGESGEDIKFSPLAADLIPFSIECKNTETASPWAWMEQAKTNTPEGRIPLVVFKRNRSDTFCMLKFEDLLRVMK